MKKLLYLAFCLLQANLLSAQNEPGVALSHYVFPEFREGVVKKKSGAENKALLNYNSITQEMIFDKDNQKYALSEINTIDTVYIDKTKFIPVDSAFMKWWAPTRLSIFMCSTNAKYSNPEKMPASAPLPKHRQ